MLRIGRYSKKIYSRFGRKLQQLGGTTRQKSPYIVTILGKVITARQISLLTKSDFRPKPKYRFHKNDLQDDRHWTLTTWKTSVRASNFQCVGTLCRTKTNFPMSFFVFRQTKALTFLSNATICTAATADFIRFGYGLNAY